jgi:hypothetical protein
MLALIAAVMLTSPAPAARAPACDEQGFPISSAAACRAECRWWSKHEQRCRDVDVEYLGEWDPRPLYWSTSVGVAAPEAWPHHPLERANAP